MESNYKKLRSINVNEHTEKKGNLTYLSWAWAVDQLLMNDPAANWEFLEPLHYGDTMMVRCAVTAFGKTMTCHLPVMDNRNKPISNPDAFQVNTAMMRCLAKGIALHGLGLYIYAGEDLPQVDPQDVQKEYEAICKEFEASIAVIKLGIANNDLSTAAEAWAELSEETKLALWKAPTKGGCFTTQERAVMKSTEFRLARGE